MKYYLIFILLLLLLIPFLQSIPIVKAFNGSEGEFGYWNWDATNKILTIVANATANAGNTEANAFNFQDIVNAITYYGWSAQYNRSNSGIQFEFNFRIVIGDGIQTTWFVDTAKEITFTANAFTALWQIAFTIRRYGYVRFGILLDIVSKATKAGVDFILTNPNFNPTLFFGDVMTDWSDDKQLFVYASSFFNVGDQTNRIVGSFYAGNIRFWHILIGEASGLGYNPLWNTILDIYDVYFASGTSPFWFYGSNGLSIDRVFATDNLDTVWTQWNTSFTVKNLISRRTTRGLFYGAQEADGNYYFVNCDSDSWIINFESSADGKLYRQYEFDLVTTVNATVIISYFGLGGGVIFNETVSDGIIPSLTLSKGFYNRTNGNNIYSFEPFNLKISKDGFDTYEVNFTISEKSSWEIFLVESSDISVVSYFYGIPLPIVLAIGLIGFGIFLVNKKLRVFKI